MSDFIIDTSLPLPPEPPLPRLLSGQKPLRPSLASTATPPVQAQLPIGTIIAFAGQVSADTTQASQNTNQDIPAPLKHITNPEPMGWLTCDGRALYISQYPELFETVGYLYGKGDKAGTFNIPDYRGYFLRGVDDGKYADESKAGDPDREKRNPPPGSKNKEGVGSVQEDAVQVHEHNYKVVPAMAMPAKPPPPAAANIEMKPIKQKTIDGLQDSDKIGAQPVKQSLTETRPRNKYVYYLIKCF